MTPKSWIKYMYMFNTYACIKKSKKHHEQACAHVMSHKIVAHTNVSRFYYMYTINLPCQDHIVMTSKIND